MPPTEVDSPVTFLQDTVEGTLRSVVHYHEGGYDLAYIRDDVDAAYTEDEIVDVVQDLGIEAFGKPQQEGFYVHGDLNCTVRCFDDAVEMNFLLSEREGIAVALDAEAFAAQQAFPGKCMEAAGIDY